MRLPDPFRNSIFRLTAFFTLGSAATSLLLFAFIYWQTAVYERERISTLLSQEIAAVAAESEPDMRRAVATRLQSDIHRVAYAGLFDAERHVITGNLAYFPADLAPDGVVRSTEVDHATDATSGGMEKQRILVIATQLPNSNIIVIGRNIDELRNLRSTVKRSLLLGVIPALMLALAAGTILSRRFHLRIIAANQTIRRIMRGNLGERLPTIGGGDDFDELAVNVNQMLDEIQRMVSQIKNAADGIAHDLRVPLVQMHARLERSRNQYRQSSDINTVVDRALDDLDVALGVIAALTRIAEIQDDRRRRAFAPVDLAAVTRAVFDLYEPLAEEKSLRFTVDADEVPPVHGDRDLLHDLMSNLVDNAIKFTPDGGAVTLQVVRGPQAGATLRVSDTGPGVLETERTTIFERFYRSRRTQHIQGHGLGLSLVRAVADLHGFEIKIGEKNPGAIFEVICPPPQPVV